MNKTPQVTPYQYAPNGLGAGPFIIRDTGGKEVEVELQEGDAKPGEPNFFGRGIVIPSTHEPVYDISQNHMVLARKLEKPRVVSMVFQFTNEHDARLIEILGRQPGIVSMRESE